ncbi:MAG TPA: tetraacyldisaccharide 4'-kinase [Gammaproteobacteria bacterium]|nr:tetraacyldisaccharide 4'-kinase [Gammaproteobacteria bacterium]
MPRSGNKLERALVATWYGKRPPPFGLQLLAYVFRGAIALRRAGYRRGLLPSRRLAVPVVVVGNITAGGSGKTPFTIWLARALRERDIRAGIVTRGYGGQARYWPRDVTPTSVAAEVGDEAVLLARATQCPVVAGPDRAAAAARLLDNEAVDVIIADDGLQHYGLARDFEIATIDGERGLGNGWLLPAGPLRETAARLDRVDCIVIKGDAGRFALPGALSMTLDLPTARSLANGNIRPLESFRDSAVHAVAGIGHPAQFFAMLREHGLDVIAHPFPDHAELCIEDVTFGDDLPVLMTEKDAVKLLAVNDERLWTVPAEARLPQVEAEDLLARIGGLVRVK